MRGLIVLVLAVLLAIVGITEGNWYGKRGECQLDFHVKLWKRKLVLLYIKQ